MSNSDKELDKDKILSDRVKKITDELKNSANENGRSIKEEKDHKRELEKEEREKRKTLKAEKEAKEGSHGDPVSQNKDGSFNFDLNSSSSNQNNIESDEEKREEKKEKIKTNTEENEEEVKDEVTDLENKENEEEAKVEQKGIPPYVRFFASALGVLFVGLIDSFATFSTGGNVTGFGIHAIFWLIPCILLFSLTPYFKIIGFIIFDFAFGMIIGSLGNFISPSIIAVLDFVPEALVIISNVSGTHFMKGLDPVYILNQHYNSPEAIQLRKDRVKAKYDGLIKNVRAGGARRLKGLLKGRKIIGGLGSANLQKGVFFAFLIAILFFGPLRTKTINIGFDMRSLIILGIFFLLLFVLQRFQLLTTRQVMAIFMFLLFLSLIKPLLEMQFLANIGGVGTDAILKIFILVAMGLLILFFSGMITSRVVVTILLLMMLGLSGPFAWGAINNPGKLQDQQERSQLELEAAIENANIFEKAQLWFQNQIALGKGENIETSSLEQTSKYIGVKISDLRPITDVFYEGKSVMFKIAFEGFVYRKTIIKTICMANDVKGIVSPNSFDLQRSVIDTGLGLSTLYPEVTCEFKDLPKGKYKVKAMAFYPYQSTVDIPLRLMSYDRYIQISSQLLNSKSSMTMEDYTGGKPQIITSSGPIIIHPSNTVDQESKQKIYSTPTIVDLEAVKEAKDGNEKPISHLSFQARKSNDDTNGEVQSINKIKFNLPEGMNIKCNGINNFEFKEHVEDNGTWAYTFEREEFNYDLRKIIDCDVYLEKEYITRYFGYSDYTTNTIFITMDYNYQQKRLYEQILEVI